MIVLIGFLILLSGTAISLIDDKLNPEPPKYKRL